MIDLDEPSTYATLDRSHMLSRVLEMDRQAEDSWRLAAALQAPDRCRHASQIVVLGMGGSAIGGDLVRTLVSAHARLPILVVRDYDLPAFVGPDTLVIASSYSGDTEETLGGVRHALEVGASVMAVTTGGQLADLAGQRGLPIVRFRYPAQPRAALGYSLFTILGALVKLGYVPAETIGFDEAVAAIRRRTTECAPDRPSMENKAKQLASALHGRLALIYGGGILSEVARRWKGQFNENAKSWAFFEQFPELHHNAVIGYEHPRELAARIVVLILTSELNHRRVRRREEVTAELLRRAGVQYEFLPADGDGALAHVCSLGVLADFTTYYLALLNGADPSTIDNIDYLKAELAKPDTSQR